MSPSLSGRPVTRLGYQGCLLLALLGSALATPTAPAVPITPATPAAVPARQQEAADLCLQYVSVRLGHLMGLHVLQTKAPQPPAQLWLVTGEDRQGTPPVSFVCALRYTPAQTPAWSLEKLDLLQLNSPRAEIPVPSTDDPDVPPGSRQTGSETPHPHR